MGVVDNFFATTADFFSELGEIFVSELDDVTDALLEIAVGFLQLFPEILKNGWALIFLLGNGLLLVYARSRLIASADGFAVVIPAVLEGFNLLIKTVDTLIGTVGTMGAALTNLINQKDVADGIDGTLFKTIPIINTDRVAQWLREVPGECAPYTSSTSVIDGLVRHSASRSVCPAMRRLYVVDWLYPWVYPIVDFFALSYDPTPPFVGSENNCAEPEKPPRWECLVIGAGYVVLELVLPLLLFSIAFSALGKPLLRLIYALLVLAFMMVVRTLEAAAEYVGNLI